MKYENTGKIFFHKWDFWSKGEHWMSSASLDIYEHFWRSINTTFKNNLFSHEGNLEIIEKILHLRTFKTNSCIEFNKKVNITKEDASKIKNLEDLFPKYEMKKVKIENFYSKWKNDDLPSDGKIYKDFHKFYSKSDHGFAISGQAYLTVKEFWDSLIVEVNPEKLEKLYVEEFNEMNDYFKELKNRFDVWISEDNQLSFKEYEREKMRKLFKMNT